jgi:hypothetical protein
MLVKRNQLSDMFELLNICHTNVTDFQSRNHNKYSYNMSRNGASVDDIEGRQSDHEFHSFVLRYSVICGVDLISILEKRFN